MQTTQPSLFARDDTFLGVCEALGQDFGFNPLYLRIALAVLLLWNPVAVIVGYVGTALLVAASRWAFPNAAPKSEPTAPQAVADNDAHIDLPLAA